MAISGGTAAPLSGGWAPVDANTLALYNQMQMAQLNGGSAAFGGGPATIYTGYGNAAPFNPYGTPAPAPVANAASGFTNIGPVPNTQYAPPAGSVVYAHYGMPQQPATTAGGPAAPAAPAAPGAPAAAPAAPAAPKPNEPNKPAGNKPAETQKKEDPKPEPKTVTVKSGDSLSKIAAAHGTTWQKLYELNKGVVGGNPNLIRPGQVLKLP